MTVEILTDSAHLRHLLITRHQEGWSIRALSRHFDISRNRVRRILRDAQRQRNNGNILPLKIAGIPRKSKLDAYIPDIKQLLEKFPAITGVRMLEELRDRGYQGGHSILQEKLKLLRPKPKSEPDIRFETEPGVQGQMDWSPYTIDFTRSGRTDILCFSYILGFSRRQYIDFTTTRDFFMLIRRHRDAFAHFGGVPLHCLYDSEKTVVIRWEAGQPLYNPSFLDFITHYRCRPIACQRGRPETKGKVEQPFKYVDGNLLNARTFIDLEDLRARARWWMKEKSDLHIHDTTHQAPIELFLAQERSALQSLPAHAYDCAEVEFRVCPPDGFIEFDTNLYSVPYAYIGEILALKATEYEVFIYNPIVDQIAHHPRHPKGACRKEESPGHHQDTKLRYGLEPVREAFLRIGDAAEEFLKGIETRHPRNPGLHARFILQLKERYCTDDINTALKHALRYYAYDAASIERILKAKALPRTLESQRNENARKRLEKALPEIKQRSLEEYQSIITPETTDNEEQRGDSCKNQEPLQDTQSQDYGTQPG